jgi:hypothetical protein
MKTKFLLFVSLLFIAFFMGCSSDESVDVSATSKTITTDDAIVNSEIDASVDDVSIIVEDQSLYQSNPNFKTSSPPITPVKTILPDCAVVTIDFTNVPNGIDYIKTIDFGTEGCTMRNGNVLKGKIIISFYKNPELKSKKIESKYEKFYHNDKLIEGSKTFTQESKGTDLLATDHPVTTHLIDVTVTFPDRKVYTRTGTNVKEMIDGFTTRDVWDDNVYKVTGGNTTTFPNGNIYTSTITTPLQITMSCKIPFPVSGIVKITKNDVEATLDYGNGDCDNLATMTTDGVSKEIQLKRKRI